MSPYSCPQHRLVDPVVRVQPQVKSGPKPKHAEKLQPLKQRANSRVPTHDSIPTHKRKKVIDSPELTTSKHRQENPQCWRQENARSRRQAKPRSMRHEIPSMKQEDPPIGQQHSKNKHQQLRTCLQEKRQRKSIPTKVSFGTVEVRQYVRYLNVNSTTYPERQSVSTGMVSKKTEKISVHEFEMQRRLRSLNRLRERAQLSRNRSKCTQTDVIDKTAELESIRFQRKQTMARPIDQCHRVFHNISTLIAIARSNVDQDFNGFIRKRIH